MIKHVWQNAACGVIEFNELHGADFLEEIMISQVSQIIFRSLIETEDLLPSLWTHHWILSRAR